MLGWILLACTTYDCEPAPQADGTRSGMEACRTQAGVFAYMNRPQAIACSGDPRATVPECVGDHGGDCATDEDCADGAVCGGLKSGYVGCECWSSLCSSDADCGAHEACVCALDSIPSGAHATSDVNAAETDVCVPAQCRTDADCESGECGALIGPCGWGIAGFYCRTKDDECRSNDECGNLGYCASSGGKWTCSAVGNCD